jgi:hypothetical protein
VTSTEGPQTVSRHLVEEACDTTGLNRSDLIPTYFAGRAGCRQPGWAVVLPGVEQLAAFGAHLTVAALYEFGDGTSDADDATARIRDMLAAAAVERRQPGDVILSFPGWTLDG